MAFRNCIEDWGSARTAYPANPAYADLFASIAALHRRLFPIAIAPLAPLPVENGVEVNIETGDLAHEGYHLTFANGITLTQNYESGKRNGLIALAQIQHHACCDLL